MGEKHAGFLRGTCWSLFVYFQLVVGLNWSDSALAITTQSFQVKATIVPGCSVTSGIGGVLGVLDFGTLSSMATGQVSTQFVPRFSLSLTCTPGVALSMRVDGGANYTTVRNLQRSGGAEQVAYRLYSDSSMGAGSEIGVDQDVSIFYSDSDNISLPLYGVAQLSGFSPAGSYTDQLTLTLSW